jgi:hypothetical protein
MPPYNEKNTSNFFGDTRTGRNHYVNGLLCVTGTATVYDDVYLGRNLNVSNAFTVDREFLYITTNVYDFQVLGKTLLNDLEVSATGVFQQLQVVGPTLLNVVEVQGPAVFDSSVLIKGLLTATGGLLVSEFFANSGTITSITSTSITTDTLTAGLVLADTGAFGYLTASSGTFLQGGLNVDNNFTVDPVSGLVTVLGDFQVLGTTLLNDLQVSATGTFQNLEVVGITSLLGPVNLYSGLSATGDAIFNNDVYIYGTLHYSGPFDIKNLVVDSITANSGTFQQASITTLVSTGSAVFNDVTILGTLTYTGALLPTDLVVNSITANSGSIGILQVSTGATIQNVYINDSLIATGPAIFHDTVTVEGLLVATGGISTSSLDLISIYAQSGYIGDLISSTGSFAYLTVSSGAIVEGGINVDNNFTVDPVTGLVTVLGDFQVLGNTLLNGLQVSSTGSFQDIEVYGSSIFLGPIFSHSGMIMTGTAVFTNDVYVQGTLYYSGPFGIKDLVVDSITAKSGTFNLISVATGAFIQNLTVQTLTASGPTYLQSLEVTGPAVFHDTVTVEGVLIATGGISTSSLNLISIYAQSGYIGDFASSTGSFAYLTVSTGAFIENLTVQTLTASGPTYLQSLEVTGPAVFHDTVTVEGLLVATGGISTSSLNLISIYAQSGYIGDLISSTGSFAYLTVSSGAIVEGGFNVDNNFTVDPVTGLVTVLGDFQVLGTTLLNNLQVSATGVFQNIKVIGNAQFDTNVVVQDFLYANGVVANTVQATTGIFANFSAPYIETNILKVSTGVVGGLNIAGNLTIGVTGPYGVTGGNVNIANILTLNASSGVMTQLGSMQVLGATLLNQCAISSTGSLSSLFVDKNVSLNASYDLTVPITITPTFSVIGIRGQVAIMSGTQSAIVNNPIVEESSHINCYLLNRGGFSGICPGIAYITQSAGSFTVVFLGPTIGDMVLGWMVIN